MVTAGGSVCGGLPARPSPSPRPPGLRCDARVVAVRVLVVRESDRESGTRGQAIDVWLLFDSGLI